MLTGACSKYRAAGGRRSDRRRRIVTLQARWPSEASPKAISRSLSSPLHATHSRRSRFAIASYSAWSIVASCLSRNSITRRYSAITASTSDSFIVAPGPRAEPRALPRDDQLKPVALELQMEPVATAFRVRERGVLAARVRVDDSAAWRDDLRAGSFGHQVRHVVVCTLRRVNRSLGDPKAAVLLNQLTDAMPFRVGEKAETPSPGFKDWPNAAALAFEPSPKPVAADRSASVRVLLMPDFSIETGTCGNVRDVQYASSPCRDASLS